MMELLTLAFESIKMAACSLTRILCCDNEKETPKMAQYGHVSPGRQPVMIFLATSHEKQITLLLTFEVPPRDRDHLGGSQNLDKVCQSGLRMEMKRTKN